MSFKLAGQGRKSPDERRTPWTYASGTPLYVGAIVFFLSGGIGFAQENPVAKTVVDIDGINFTLPAGFQVARVASEPLVKWPVVADWDDQRRLVVVESAGVSRPIDQHNEQRLHRVVRLVDKDGDGTYDERVLAADNLPFAEGVLCLGNSMLVAAPPQIFKLTDNDGDGYCEQREVWFDGQTITGCANDLHGPYEGRDGWIYWCKGAFAEQTHDLTSGGKLVTSAAHIFRRKPDGGPIEAVMTGGMDNPVEVAILPGGERFFTSTFLVHPSDGKRDGIAHAIYGGVYGKDHHVINGHRRTGDLMPIMVQFAAAAPSGLICLESPNVVKQVFPDTENVLAATQFNLHRVTLHGLSPKGATYESQDVELLVADRIDFHPTDVIEDTDGSLIVLDTGGWYDLCCPSSRVDQKAASGGIYRVSCRKPAAKISDSEISVREQTDAVWRLCRAGTPDALGQLKAMLSTQSAPPMVLSAASHAIGLHRWENALPELHGLALNHADPQVCRAAAEAIGRIGKSESVNVLMQAVTNAQNDRILEHSLLYALMEINQSAEMLQYIDGNSPVQQRAALIVLDQTAPDTLTTSTLFAAALSKDEALQRTAVAIIETHPESPVGDETLKTIESFWSDKRPVETNSDVLKAIVRGWSEQSEIQTLFGEWLGKAASDSPEYQLALLDLLSQYRGSSLPESWIKPLTAWVEVADADQVQDLAQWLKRYTSALDVNSPLTMSLLHGAEKFAAQTETFLMLFAAAPRGTLLADALLADSTVNAFLQPENEALAVVSGEALQRVRLPRQAARKLLENVDTVPPLGLSTAIGAISGVGDDELDASLLDKLKSVRAARTLPADQITNLYRSRSNALKNQAAELVAFLREPPRDVREHVVRVMTELSQLPPGDPLKGYEVFRSSKAACSACHRMGYIGRTIGPDLTRIGASRTRADMLEAILFPSSRLEQSYQPIAVATKDGQVHNGLVRNQTADRLELVTGPDKSVTLLVADIEDRAPSEVSIMPAGLDKLISTEELAHLLALLEAAK